MKKLLSLTLLLVVVVLAFAQEARKPHSGNYRQAALQSMVDTERAFAKMSEDQGVRSAFLAYIADDGILFRPMAVQGKQWMKEHPVPASEKRPMLSWYPTAAGMARTVDLGYTTGPWEYKADIHDASPVAWGTFLTVWKRQPDSSWKFAIDLGISHQKPDRNATAWQLPNNSDESRTVSRRDVKVNTDKLLARDREFSSASAARGARAAFVDYSASEVRLYRDGRFPFVGRDAATAAIPALAVWTWEPTAAGVSLSNDLGYTYGTYKLMDKPVGPILNEFGNYFRIWKADDNGWQVLFDVTNVVPQEPNKN